LGYVGVDFDDSVAFADRELLAGKELMSNKPPCCISVEKHA
jgi:hypothetical protein